MFTASLNVAVRHCLRMSAFSSQFLFSRKLETTWRAQGGGFKRGFEDTFQTPLSVKDAFKTSFKPPCACWVYREYSATVMFESFIETCDRNLVLVQTSNKLLNYVCLTVI